MNKFKNKISFVIATKDRPKEVMAVLDCLEEQSQRPNEVIIVDGGDSPIPKNSIASSNFPVKYFRYSPPSAARQRNAGIKAVCTEVNLIGFFDDDIVLDSNALERMLVFWEEASEDIMGASFNLVNHPTLAASDLKYSYLAEKLGIYHKKVGRVLRSGFQTMIGTVDRTMEIQWLPTGAAVWRRTVFNTHKFDDWFAASSYLEDLDFSYRAGKFHRLAVVADARYFHYPASGGRENSFSFGKREVANRLYFVRKHSELSVGRCIFSLGLRMLMSFYLFAKSRNAGYLLRLLGNIGGFKQFIK
jgi:glycosyltransferase involved in cell wall biosynthesis